MTTKNSVETQTEYEKYVNGKNFRQIETIVSGYNGSIKNYERFREAVLTRKYNTAAEELTHAAMKLAATVEWSAKHVIFQIYDPLANTDPSNLKFTELDRKRRFKELNNEGKEKNMTVYSLLQIILQDKRTVLNNAGIFAFPNMCNKTIRTNLINGYKHDGTQPDSSAYVQTLNELYNFIITLILDDNSKSKLRGLTDNYPNSWEELFISCEYFSPNTSRRYILLTDCVESMDNIRNLFKINWDMVLDLSYKDEDGRQDIFDQYISLTDRKTVIKKYLCDFYAEDSMPVSTQTYWIKINGRENAVKQTEMIRDDKHLATAVRRSFPRLLAAFAREYDLNIELIVLGCSFFTRTASSILQIFDDTYSDTGELKVHFLDCDNVPLRNSIVNGVLLDRDTCKFYKLPLDDFAREIAASVGEYNKVSDGGFYLPGNSFIEYDTYEAMKSYLELVYIGIEKDCDPTTKQQRGLNFLQGNVKADWDIVCDDNYVVPQNNEISMRDEIIRHIQDGSRFIYNVEYEAGLGGTTFMRKMAYLLHDDFPTIVLNRYIENDVASTLWEIYRRTLKGLIIFIDSNSISYAETLKLQKELLKNYQFSFVIVFLARSQEKLSVNRHLSRLNYSQCKKMHDNLHPFIDNSACERNLLECIERTKSVQMSEEALPFVLAMYAFNENFKGISDYVRHSLEPLNSVEREIILTLALADYGANYKVSGQYIKTVYGNKVFRKMLTNSAAVAPLVRVILDSSGKKRSFQMKYSLFTREVLVYLSGGKNLSFLKLADSIIDIIKNSHKDIYAETDEETIKLLNKLFIERGGNQTENELNIKGVYSPLITHLVDESGKNNTNQYDNSGNLVVNILKTLADIYPDQPHFAGHLARYYFYSDQNFDLGFQVITEAIQNASNIERYSMGSLLHIKAMGYSARIQRQHLPAIRNAMDHARKTGEYREDVLLIAELVKKIRTDRMLAIEIFEEAKKETTSRFASNIAECEMTLQILTVFDLLRTWCAERSLDEIVAEKEQLEMHDRVDNLIEDSEHRLQGSKGESDYNNVDLLKRIKEQRTFSQAKGEELKKICKQLIETGTSDMSKVARRELARLLYQDVQDNLYSAENQDQLREIVAMMEENIENDPSNNANFRIWFNALRALETERETISTELDRVFAKLEKWTSVENTSVDAYYYKYIVKFIQAFEEGVLDTSDKVQSELNDLLRDLQNASEDALKATIPFEWFSDYGIGLRRLIPNSELNRMTKTNIISTLHPFLGYLPNKESFNTRTAFISFVKQKVYFNPQSVIDRISSNMENQYVDFGVGFTYSGLRAYHDTIICHRGVINSVKKVIPKAGERVKVKVLGANSSYVKTEIVNSNGVKCDVRISEMEILGIDRKDWTKIGFEFQVVLSKANILPNGSTVWWINITKSVSKGEEFLGYTPFKNISISDSVE